MTRSVAARRPLAVVAAASATARDVRTVPAVATGGDEASTPRRVRSALDA